MRRSAIVLTLAVAVIVLMVNGPSVPVWLLAAVMIAMFIPGVWFPGPTRVQPYQPATEARRAVRSRALGMSNRVRLVVLLAAIAALFWFVPASPAKAPLMFIVVGLPLVFELVPRNWLYGLRTPQTLLSPDDVWYAQNRFTGIAMVATGLIWGLGLALR